MIFSNNNFSYEIAWQKLKTISEPAMLIVAVIHLGRLLFETGEKRVFGPLGMGVHEFEALFSIAHREKATPTILAASSLMPPAKITRVLDRLEKQEAITRHPDKGDRRSYSLAITEKGRELLARAIASFKQSCERLESELGAENLKIMSRFVVGMIENIGGKTK
jgi:DNA-binding MarR family transcriptional regulator